MRSVACDVTRENLDALAALLVAGDVRVIIGRTHRLDDAAGAVAHMMGRRARGKIAVVV